MIVLDEQLTGRGIDATIRNQYRGNVRFINDLRPGTVIKDDAIPALLSAQREPTFVTINVTDFWQQVAITECFCVVCLALPDSRVLEVPELLRQVLRIYEFKTKRSRMGKVIRVAGGTAVYYSDRDRVQRTQPLR